MSSTRGKLPKSKSKSARDVLFGSKAKMKSIRSLMGSLHSAHNKSTGHIELSSDSEDDTDEFGQDCSQASGNTSRCTNRGNNAGGSSTLEDTSIGDFLGDEGRPESHKENVQNCQNAQTGADGTEMQGETKLRRLISVEVETEATVASPFPASPTSVVTVMDASPASPKGSPPRKGSLKPPSPRTAGRRSGSNLQKANSIGALIVDNGGTFPLLKESSPTTSSGKRKFSSCVQKSKSMRSINVNPVIPGEDQLNQLEQGSCSRDRRSQRSVKKNSSSGSLHSSKGRRSSSRKNDDPALSLDSEGARRSGRGIKKTKPDDVNEENTNSTIHKRGSQSSARKARSMRNLNVPEEDLGASSSFRSSCSRARRGIQSATKSRSMRSLNTTIDDPRASTDKVSSSRKCSSKGSSTATARRRQNSTTTMPAATTRRRLGGSLQHSTTQLVHTTSTHHAPQSMTRSRSARSFNVNKEQQTNSNSKNGTCESKKDALSRSKSTSLLDTQGESVRRVISTGQIASSRTAKSLAENEDSNSLSGPISLSKVTEEKWQRRRSKSRSRDSRRARSRSRRARSRSRKANGKSSSLHASSPNLIMDIDLMEQREHSKQSDKVVRRTRQRASIYSFVASAADEFIPPPQDESSKASEQLVKRKRSRSRQTSKNRTHHASSPNLSMDLADRVHQNGAAKLSEQDNQPSVPARKRSSKSTSRKSKDDGSTPKGSTTDADTGERVNGSPRARSRGHGKKDQAEKPKRKRSKSLKGLKDLRTKLGHSSGPILSPKGCNHSVTSGSISSLTMSSRLFSHDDHSLASSQRSPYRRAYSTPKLFVAGELSSSLLVENEGDETTEGQLENRGSRWESLPQSKNRQSMDVLPVAPDHDVSSYVGLLASPSLSRSVSEGGGWSGDNSKGDHVEADSGGALGNKETSSFARFPASDTPSHSVHSNMGWISELTPGTFISPAANHDRSSSQRKASCGERNNKNNNIGDFFASFSNLLLEDTQNTRRGSPNKKGDSIPRRVRRHSFDSVTSFPCSEQSGSGRLMGKPGLSPALTQVDGENDNAPKIPARRTSTGSSVQYASSHSRKACG